MAGIFGLLMSGAGVIKDQYFNLTSLLLPGNGTNGAQNNTFLDSSTNNFTITRNGNTTQGTFSPFSQTGWGNYFDGSGDYLTTPNNSALYLTTNNFTLEGWIYLASTSTTQNIVRGANSFSIGILQSSGSLIYYISSNGSSWDIASAVSMGSITANAWVHFALVRNGSTFTPYINGVAGTTTTSSSSIANTNGLIVFAETGGTLPATGYCSNLRLVNGTAVYTAAFTPPTSPLTAITNTSLLTCQSNRFRDASTNNFTITANGNTSVVAFSPFAPTAAYTTAAVGGSGYFDGTGDYLSLSGASLTPSGVNVTIDFWFYPTATGTNLVLFQAGTDTTGDMQCLFDSSVGLRFQITGTSGSLNTNYRVNAWNYVVCVKSGTSFTVYVNNVAGNTATLTPNNTTSLSIGGRSTGSNMTGYISGFRFTTGAANTPSSIPTSPPTTSVPSGTVAALLNFTNAGITDATSKNDLETVGNAQISTTQSKWGGSSMYFDGTGDYLVEPNNINYDFGSGDFTIEFWMYSSQSAAGAGIVAKRSGGGAGNTNWMINCATGAINFYASDGTTYQINALGGGTVNNSAWHHVAVTRSGSSFRVFVDGTQVGSTGTWSGTIASTSRSFYVGVDDTSSVNYYAGYLQDLRITKGYARYTANFTAPTAAFPTL